MREFIPQVYWLWIGRVYRYKNQNKFYTLKGILFTGERWYWEIVHYTDNPEHVDVHYLLCVKAPEEWGYELINTSPYEQEMGITPKEWLL